MSMRSKRRRAQRSRRGLPAQPARAIAANARNDHWPSSPLARVDAMHVTLRPRWAP